MAGRVAHAYVGVWLGIVELDEDKSTVLFSLCYISACMKRSRLETLERFGLDRAAMIKYDIPNIRTLFENDVRVLQQF